MSDPIRIESLVPQPLPGLRRVSLKLLVSGLPGLTGSFPIQFADLPPGEEGGQIANRPPGTDAPGPDAARSPSPYPDVTLSILDQRGNKLVTTYIVEHKEPELEFTLHLRASEPGATCVARAEMSMNDEVIQTVEVPFELSRGL